MKTDAPLHWIKSSYSGSGGSCVEWAPAHAFAVGMVPVRDSKNRSGPVLNFSAVAFAAFVGCVKEEEFGSH
ncbi:DUF397 domain-containing protein [Streptomyces sp. NBC_00102]|uniref:DUF397 domain-containing protein n=1 Tax=Streptomyces sp. NBC_00102 TaxID=2975652 RepID=UPI002259D82F|nr:DUF397 domain-containing protein [Streptomyces sp. NBC_00102]MCX5399247.1 DUF397 domain-containing protein [Streptomyces sp. NBC_00102]